MGQKTNPIGLRLGIIKSWESRWFSEKNYSELLKQAKLFKVKNLIISDKKKYLDLIKKKSVKNLKIYNNFDQLSSILKKK